MIKFACPGCSSVFTVEDSKAGKTGKCPKCSAQFVIPELESAPADVPPSSASTPPSGNATGDVEIKPCPGCQAKLTVAASDLGLDVECPYCKAVYKATKPGGTGKSVAMDDRPSRRRRDDDDDGYDEDDQPGRRRDRYDDDDDGDRPRKKRRRTRSYEPHRGVMLLIMSIIGFFCCCILDIVVIILASQDLNKMNDDSMDPEGRGLTRAAQIIGITALVVKIVLFFARAALGVAIGG